jgi:1-phosphatidylinositol phosphodiesterase
MVYSRFPSTLSSLIPATEVDASFHQSTTRKPALAVVKNTVYCLFVGLNEKLWFSEKTYNKEYWQTCVMFPDKSTHGAPALGAFKDTLHAVVSRHPNQDLIHYQYDMKSRSWGVRAFLGQRAGGLDLSPVSLVEFKGFLYCAYNSNDENKITIQKWSPKSGWMDPIVLADHWTHGEPSVFVMNGKLKILYVSTDEEKKMIEISLDEDTSTWSRDLSPREKSLFGLSVASIDPLGFAYVAFQAQTESGQIGISAYNNSNSDWSSVYWTEFDSIQTPTLCFIDNQIVMVWNDRAKDGVLMWTVFNIEITHNTKTWMSQLDDQRPLSDITIPGTHESCCMASVPWRGCQSLPIDEQASMGIRAFDFRVGFIGGQLILTNNGSSIDGVNKDCTLQTALNLLYRWLDDHPTEALVIQIKEEGSAGSFWSRGTMGSELWAMISTSKYWILQTTLPKLGDCRGKIQLLRRFSKPAILSSWTPFGIDVDGGWLDNQPSFTLSSPGFPITIQDCYTGISIDEKWKAIQAMLQQGQKSDSVTSWHFNYCNMDSPFSPHMYAVTGIHRPDSSPFASSMWGINEKLLSYFTAALPSGYGLVMMDFPESQPGLVLTMISKNFP